MSDPANVTGRSAGAEASTWTGRHVLAIGRSDADAPAVITERDITRVCDQLDIWDAWPIQDDGGMPFALPGGVTLWMALSSPRFEDPNERHGHARIRLLSFEQGRWTDLGPAMPDDYAPGSREWSGSAVLEDDGRSLTLYFTAAGRRGEASPTFEQRLFRAEASLVRGASGYALADWTGLGEFVVRDPKLYMAGDDGGGAVGTIKAFRDPAYFRDPKDGARYVFFAGSKAGSASAFNGVIGAATPQEDPAAPWRLLPPLISADGLNNELERPHVICRDGLYYLFWSTQSHVFDPTGPVGPTGLYGMVSDSLLGDWRPLNGSGLVFCNPASAPRQAYSWLVMPDLQVTSFVDDWGDDAGRPALRFGATFAPMVRLWLKGDKAGVEG